MEERVIMASKFKAQCLALIDQVATTKVPLVITKRGRPVARVVPVQDRAGSATMGSVALLAAEDRAYYSTREAWDADA